MTNAAEKLYKEALALSENERAGLAEELLNSLDKPDPKIDALWAKEAEERLKAYESGEIRSFSSDEVFSELNSH